MACLRTCMLACMRACMRAYVRACVRAGSWILQYPAEMQAVIDLQINWICQTFSTYCKWAATGLQRVTNKFTTVSLCIAKGFTARCNQVCNRFATSCKNYATPINFSSPTGRILNILPTNVLYKYTIYAIYTIYTMYKQTIQTIYKHITYKYTIHKNLNHYSKFPIIHSYKTWLIIFF